MHNLIKLKYKLDIWGDTIIFEVLDMDERFRYKSEAPSKSFEYKASNGMRVRSYLGPLFSSDNILYLRGFYTSEDHKVALLDCSLCSRNPQEIVKEIHQALEEWAANWEGWLEQESNVYVV